MVHATIKQDSNIYSIGGQQSLYLHSAFNKETENQDSNALVNLTNWRRPTPDSYQMKIKMQVDNDMINT